MTVNPRTRRTATNWRFALPEVTAPAGGALFKVIGHTSTWAAIGVGLAPYAVCMFRYAIFLVLQVSAEICYLCSSESRQEAIHNLMVLTTNSLVSLQILTLMDNSVTKSRKFPANKPELRVLDGGPDPPAEQGS
jgi:acetyl-CoA carboxylase alpha subunit